MRVMSDIHLEWGDYIHPGEGDLLILAGDIHLGKKVKSWIDLAAKSYDDVIYVPGNHEFYKNSVEDVLNQNFPRNVHFLYNDFVMIGNQKFVGTTLWSYAQPVEAFYISKAMNDYRLIRYQDRKLTVEDTNQFHKEAVEYLDKHVDGSIVVTHHLPSYSLIHEKYEGSLINAAYASNSDSLVARAKMWIHGHTHCSHDIILHGTRVICNPKGYLNENPSFNKQLVI